MVTLDRGMGLLQATATNIIGMVGVGPFLTIPFMVTAMGGPHIIYAWAFGAVLALCDGLVYAELGAALPGSGGPYVYLREAYAPFGLGRLMAFVFIFQVMLVAPLSIAGGAVGFADYLGFYWTSMRPAAHHLIAGAVCVAMTVLLYRDIRAIGRLAVLMLTVVLATVGWVIVAGSIVRSSRAGLVAFAAFAVACAATVESVYCEFGLGLRQDVEADELFESFEIVFAEIDFLRRCGLSFRWRHASASEKLCGARFDILGDLGESRSRIRRREF